MTASIELLDYKSLVSELENTTEINHLLLGNGFNRSLSIHTTYQKIFDGMKLKYPLYSKVENFLSEHSYNIELLIAKLHEYIPEGPPFLVSFIENKIKLDFMQSAYTIVNDSIKNVYTEKSDGIHLLFKNFDNYFTLNYDPLLYLLLIRFKNDTQTNQSDPPTLEGIAFSNNSKHILASLSEEQREIYKEIKLAHESGRITVNIAGLEAKDEMSKIPKVEFHANIKKYFKERNLNFRGGDIKEVIDLFWRNKTDDPKFLNIDDGFIRERNGQLSFSLSNVNQNVFFLHGAFHIKTQDKKIVKITQTQEKAFYQRLEDIVNSEADDVICILTGESQDKKEQIDKDEYLSHSYSKLHKLEGNLVIFGSSMAKNDKHIFDEIEKSEISCIYISTDEERKYKTAQDAESFFSTKTLKYFDYKSVSYATK